MRADTERVARTARVRTGGARVLTAGCVLILVSGAAGCANTGEDSEDSGGSTEGSVRSPLDRGDVAAVERDDLETVFTEAGVEGTFVLYDVGERSATVVGPEEANERAVPASTFHLPQTLIALETGAIEDVDEVLPHGGGSQPVPEWERDMSAREALPASNAPVYQEMARRIGHGSMSTWVDRFDYGNRSVGEAEAVDRFWQEGPLEISAMEQTEFLAGLARAELPVDSGNQRALHEIAVTEEGEGYILTAENGPPAESAARSESESAPGWWVGWVEREGDLYTFALRIDAERDADADLPEPLGRQLLVELRALPPEAVDS